MKIIRKMFSNKEVENIRKEGKKTRAKKAAIGLGTAALVDAAILGPSAANDIKYHKSKASDNVIINKVKQTNKKLINVYKHLHFKPNKTEREREALQGLDKHLFNVHPREQLRQTEEFIRNHDKKTMKLAAEAGKKAGRKAIVKNALLLAAPVVAAGISVARANKKQKAEEDKKIAKLGKGEKK